eukprot:TRINITY_DN96088_c0_g1_i1.p1 TRINITY_DN96088_c0_g1~~TRINITY_DN96088_c0_g1_i1.p1  ORF type:complete len:182 (-),score=9.91 TRINITY_DN96088_c0_g1_i1:147-671(-)
MKSDRDLSAGGHSGTYMKEIQTNCDVISNECKSLADEYEANASKFEHLDRKLTIGAATAAVFAGTSFFVASLSSVAPIRAAYPTLVPRLLLGTAFSFSCGACAKFWSFTEFGPAGLYQNHRQATASFNLISRKAALLSLQARHGAHDTATILAKWHELVALRNLTEQRLRRVYH